MPNSSDEQGRNYEVLTFGHLYLGGPFQPRPKIPIGGGKGDIPPYRLGESIDFGDTAIERSALQWIKPHGMNFYVSDRAVLANIGWRTLNEEGFVEGRTVTIDGRKYRCRLLASIEGEKQGVANEWDILLDIVGTDNDLLHWQGISCWTAERMLSPANSDGSKQILKCFARGQSYAREWHEQEPTCRSPLIAFRPVLEQLEPRPMFGRTVKLDEQVFCISIPYGEPTINSDWDRAFLYCMRNNVQFSASNEYSLCQLQTHGKGGLYLRGAETPLHWGRTSGDARQSYFGFRPLLRPAGGGQNPFDGLKNGSIVQMYTLLMDGEPVNPDIHNTYRRDAPLTFTDKFYGEQYLIRWVIYDGQAMACSNLVESISWQDLSNEGYCDGSISAQEGGIV